MKYHIIMMAVWNSNLKNIGKHHPPFALALEVLVRLQAHARSAAGGSNFLCHIGLGV